jgi:hypothetical protein
MLSGQGKRLQARKRPAELAAKAPTKKRDDVSSAAAAYDTQEKPHNKNQENHCGKQQSVARR